MKRLFLMLATVGAIFAVTVPAASSSSPTSFNLAKTCDDQGTCTVTWSSTSVLPVGTTETYLGPQFGDPVLSSRVLLATPNGGTAVGHCTWPLRAATGTCTFAQGTGTLAGFHANLTVSANEDFTVFYWAGTYQL